MRRFIEKKPVTKTTVIIHKHWYEFSQNFIRVERKQIQSHIEYQDAYLTQFLFKPLTLVLSSFRTAAIPTP